MLARRLGHGQDSNGDAFAAGAAIVLRTLSEHGPQTVPQIARQRNTSRQNIQIIVNRLTRDGHVEFVNNPAHKRSELVRLTDPGRLVSEKADRHEAAFVTSLASRLSPGDAAGASSVLRRIRELLGEGRDRDQRSEVTGQKRARKGAGRMNKKEAGGQRPEDRRTKTTEKLAEEAPAAGVTSDESELPYNLL